MRIMLPGVAVCLGTAATAAVPMAPQQPQAPQNTPAAPSAADPLVDQPGDIVVTAQRIRGAVVTDVPPVLELDEKAVESYGAASITELLASLSPQTGPGRGRGGGGRPVVLLNGQRISSFRELRDLPPEAILRVQILPEEVALQYGFPPDQRVVNFILKDKFRSITLETENGVSTAGTRIENQAEGSFVRIGNSGRFTASAEYNRATRVLESDRGIIQRGTIFPVSDTGAYRTLLPKTESLKLNAVYNRKLTQTVAATFNVGYQRDTNDALLGLSTTTLNIPAGESFSQPGAPTSFARGFLPTLGRASTIDALHGGLTVTGNISKYNWTLTGNYDRSTVDTLTDRGVDPVALQALVSAPASSFNPFLATPSATVPFLPQDTARSQTDTSDGLYTITGPVIELPAGSVRTTLRAGFATTRLNSQSQRIGTTLATRLSRNEGNGRINVEIPIASSARGFGSALGKLSINGNFTYRHLSDFGNLISYGYGLNWQPTPGLTLLASAIDTDTEPAIGDLGNPILITPAIPTYDFTTGQNVLVNRISGGNPSLVTEMQRDAKFSIEYEPPKLKGLGINIDYFHNRSRNPTNPFPILTPDIETAFPGRVTRDASSRLVTIDARPVNFSSTASDVVRVGFTFQKSFGQQPGGAGGGRRSGGGGGGGGGRSDEGGGGGSRGGLGRGGGRFGADGGRWTVALYDSIRFRDQIQIRPNLPVLDLLGGNATGSSGGAPRHSFDLDSGWFNKGLGFRLTGSFQSGSVVTGTTAASTLNFGNLATLNANVFFNFDNRKQWVTDHPFLKGVRVRVLLQNITNSIRTVRDGTGAVPLSFQPGFLDARGRFFRIDLRKRF